MKTFNEIYSEYNKMVLHFLSSKLPREVAEEVTQDVFLRVHNHLDSFDENKAKMSTWIFSIARNAVIDYYRKKQDPTTSINEFVDDEGKELFEASIGTTPVSEIVGRESLKMYRSVILGLPMTYKRVANLFFNCEYSYEEISDRMRVPVGTVKGQLSRARTMIQSKLERA